MFLPLSNVFLEDPRRKAKLVNLGAVVVRNLAVLIRNSFLKPFAEGIHTCSEWTKLLTHLEMRQWRRLGKLFSNCLACPQVDNSSDCGPSLLETLTYNPTLRNRRLHCLTPPLLANNDPSQLPMHVWNHIAKVVCLGWEPGWNGQHVSYEQPSCTE